MDRLSAAFDEFVEKFKEISKDDLRSPVEKLLDEHLKNNSNSIPAMALNDFASRTNNAPDYKRIMHRIWTTIDENITSYHLVKKALTLLHYLLINGNKRIIEDCRDESKRDFVRELARSYNRSEFEQYEFSKDLDVGAGVRKVASQIYELFVNEKALSIERKKAASLHRKLSDRGVRSANSSPLTSPRQFVGGTFRPSTYSDSSSNGWDLGGKGHIIHKLDEDEGLVDTEPEHDDSLKNVVEDDSLDLIGLKTLVGSANHSNHIHINKSTGKELRQNVTIHSSSGTGGNIATGSMQKQVGVV